MDTLFSSEEINKNRQLEFDLMKTLTILLMIWTHVFEELSTEFEPSLSATNAFYRGGIFGAATFMFCMGMGMVYTRRNTPEDYFHRGLHIIFIGALLNVCRQLIPSIVTGSIFADPPSAAHLVELLGVDILQFAGLAFLLMALLRKIGLRYRSILIVSVAMSISAYFLEGVQTGNFFIDQALGYLWGNDSESYFPLLNWFIFPAAGCWFGKLYLHLKNKALFHKVSLPVGLVLTVLYIEANIKGWWGGFLLFSSERFLAHRMLPDAIMSLIANVWQITLFYYIAQVIPQKAIPALTHPSKHITQYYCVSWVVICFIGYIFGEDLADTDGTTILLWLFVLVTTIGIVTIYNKYLQERFNAFFGRARWFWVTLVFVAMLAAGIYGYFQCTGTYPTFLNGYSI